MWSRHHSHCTSMVHVCATLLLLRVTSGVADDSCVPDKEVTEGVQVSDVMVSVTNYYHSMGNYQPYGPLNRSMVAVRMAIGETKQVHLESENSQHTLALYFSGSHVCASITHLYLDTQGENFIYPKKTFTCSKACFNMSTPNDLLKIPFFQEKGGEVIRQKPVCCVFEYNNYVEIGAAPVEADDSESTLCYSYSGPASNTNYRSRRSEILCPPGEHCWLQLRYTGDNGGSPLVSMDCSHSILARTWGCPNMCQENVVKYNFRYKQVCNYCCESDLCNDMDNFHIDRGSTYDNAQRQNTSTASGVEYKSGASLYYPGHVSFLVIIPSFLLHFVQL